MSPQIRAGLAAFDRGAPLRWLTAWVARGLGRRDPPLACLAVGGLAAALSILMGSFLKAGPGGGEPLMAVFPILMVATLGWGAKAGWPNLIGGFGGAWYIYVGQPFSFVVSPTEAAGLVTAFAVGALIIGACVLLREFIASLGDANAALRLTSSGLTERTEQLGALNARLEQALSERTEALDALSLSEAYFRVGFEAASVGKVQADPLTGRIIRANAAFAGMLGYEGEDMAGRMGWEFTRPEDIAADQAEFQLVLNGPKKAYVREKQYVKRNGEHVWARVSAVVVRSPADGSPLVIISVIENIQERHEATAALAAARRDLEVTLCERTDALTQRDLLLREVYHRVKNNLQIIDSLLAMQGRRLADPEAKAALASLRDRVFALGLVHHQLMGSADLRTFDIAPFLKELSENILQGGAGRGIALSVRAQALTVGLDFAIPLGLVVTELVTNSLKHAFPTGTGAVEIVLERDGEGTIILVVSDNGRGISEPAAADATVSSMGTTIIDGLVKQLGGTLTILSGRGARSEIRIPGAIPL